MHAVNTATHTLAPVGMLDLISPFKNKLTVFVIPALPVIRCFLLSGKLYTAAKHDNIFSFGRFKHIDLPPSLFMQHRSRSCSRYTYRCRKLSL